MYPHERSLVKRLADQPFALIGINSDKDREKLKETMKDEGITWRSFWNGGSTSGPISTEWNVSGWPTLYVLDAEGVIRFKSVGAGEYEPVIDRLLAQMKQEEAEQANLIPAAHSDYDPEEELQELTDAYDEAYAAFLEKYRAAEGEEGQAEAMKLLPDPAGHAAGFLAFAGKYARTPHALEAAKWVLSRVQQSEALGQALEIVVTDHIADESLGDVVLGLAYSPGEDVSEGLRIIAYDSPHRDVRGKSTLALGQQLKYCASIAGKSRSAELLAEYELMMDMVLEKYADVPYYGDNLLGSAAEGELYELKNLQIGMPVPDIEAEDVDGVSFKLSDYRGKVVMLDFWGHW